MLRVLHDGNVVFNEENTSGTNYENVKVYLSDPWYYPAADDKYLRMYHLKISDRAPPSGIQKIPHNHFHLINDFQC